MPGGFLLPAVLRGLSGLWIAARSLPQDAGVPRFTRIILNLIVFGVPAAGNFFPAKAFELQIQKAEKRQKRENNKFFAKFLVLFVLILRVN
jgi:hypothetical protein